jgi:hypothetical protein
MNKLFTTLLVCLCGSTYAQFAPQAGMAGSTAIEAGSPLIAGWASTCTVQRGYIDIANYSAGHVTVGEDVNGINAADGAIVCLGDSGVAVLTFPGALYNGPGADFAVFENGFKNPADASMAFLELAFVEVSSDGTNFFRFPATSNTQTTTQIPGSGVYMDASLLDNLAGKYVANYGTPFDLEELAGTPGLDVNNITHVRLVDVVGAVSGHGSKDNEGKYINDPYPTNFPTGGFDLDAVAALHMAVTAVPQATSTATTIYPNPANGAAYITLPAGITNATVVLTNITGQVLQQLPAYHHMPLSLSGYPAGLYTLHITGDNGYAWTGKLVTY